MTVVALLHHALELELLVRRRRRRNHREPPGCRSLVLTRASSGLEPARGE
jgi:hypothetical protein